MTSTLFLIKARNFGWQMSQIDSQNIREWLCKDAANPSDPNPVEAEHVYVQMAKNFPSGGYRLGEAGALDRSGECPLGSH